MDDLFNALAWGAVIYLLTFFAIKVFAKDHRAPFADVHLKAGLKYVKITDRAGVHYWEGDDALDKAMEYLRSRPPQDRVKLNIFHKKESTNDK